MDEALFVLPRDGVRDEAALDKLPLRYEVAVGAPPKSLWVDRSTSVTGEDGGEHQGQSWFLVSQPSSFNLCGQLARFEVLEQGRTSWYQR